VGRHRQAARGFGPGAAPGEDEDRVRQRREPPRRLRAHLLRCPRPPLPGPSRPWPGGYFTGFSPAISSQARKANGHQISAWHLNRRSGTDLSGLAGAINPQVRGWISYYRAFCRSGLRFPAGRINEHLARWAMHKFKRFRGKHATAMAWLQKVYQYQPRLFAHRQLAAFTAGRTVGPDDGRLSRPVLRAAGGVRLPPPTHPASPVVFGRLCLTPNWPFCARDLDLKSLIEGLVHGQGGGPRPPGWAVSYRLAVVLTLAAVPRARSLAAARGVRPARRRR
jgi:hypothetical protein